MDHNFPEALDVIIFDGGFARRSCNAKQQDKYITVLHHSLVFNDGKPYVPTNEDIFAEDWQLFGKGLLGKNKKEKK